MTETLEQSVKRTAEYPFFCCCMKCVTARRLGNWLIFFFESIMDDDDWKGGEECTSDTTTSSRTIADANQEKKALCFFRHFPLWSKRLLLLQLINV